MSTARFPDVTPPGLGGSDTLKERVERAERFRFAPREWNGYDPSESERMALDAELERGLS
jgi:hypothetical protein